MKKSIYLNVMTLIFISAFLLTCKKDKDPVVLEQEVSFAIDNSNFSNVSSLKSAMAYNLSDAKKIVLTIQNVDGTPTNYTSTEVKIYQMNGVFLSQKLMLHTGSYRLTEFLLLDSTGSVIFAVPIAGAQAAQNVNHPLPISFDVLKDVSSSINVEVLSTENMSPADIGLTSFSISEALNFMIGVTDLPTNRLLKAKLTVFSGSYLHVQMLDSIANNLVIIKDSLGSLGLRTYTLVLEIDGYITYSHLFTKDDLRIFSSEGNHLPMLVEMEKAADLGSVTDIDGNVYHTVAIGAQVWMVENLKTTRYRNGDPIPNITDDTQWSNLLTGAYCDYNNDPNNSTIYGKLYNFYVVTDNRNVAPDGWHVSTDAEWSTLLTYLGGRSDDALKLKETGTTHWMSPNTGTNITGFNALPGGSRNQGKGWVGRWWTSTKLDDGNNAGRYWYIMGYYLRYINLIGNDGAGASSGFSVRCVRDQRF
jgi:uncharacterized protein (TIGR02145 family)